MTGRHCTRLVQSFHPILDIRPFLALRLMSGCVALMYVYGYVLAVSGNDDPFARSTLLRAFAASGGMMVAFAYLWGNAHDAIEQQHGYLPCAEPPATKRAGPRGNVRVRSCTRAAGSFLACFVIALSINFVVRYPARELGIEAAIRAAEACRHSWSDTNIQCMHLGCVTRSPRSHCLQSVHRS